MPVLSLEFLKPFGIVVGVITAVVAGFNKFGWAWKIFQDWYVKRPDLRGTWKIELKSNWVDPQTNEEIPPIMGYMVVRQSLSDLSMRLFTAESKSKLIAHSIEREQDGLYRVVGIYQNEPDIELQGARSEIHYGAWLLDVIGNPPISLEGHYWTDRSTMGLMKLSDRLKAKCDTYEQAKEAFGD